MNPKVQLYQQGFLKLNELDSGIKKKRGKNKFQKLEVKSVKEEGSLADIHVSSQGESAFIDELLPNLDDTKKEEGKTPTEWIRFDL